MPGHIRNLNDLLLHMCKSLPFILCSILFSKSTHPLISIDFTTLASASTQLRKRFRSGRRSWWSPSARQRSSGRASPAKTFGQNRWSSFHVPPLHSFDLWLRPLEALVPLFGVNLGVANLPRWTRSKPVDVDKPFSCQQKNFVGLVCGCFSICVKTCNTLCWDGRACLLLNTLSFMFTPKIISLKSWTWSKHM